MSRLGKLPIELPSGLQVKLESGFIIVKGAKGELRQAIHPAVVVEILEKEILVTVKPEYKNASALWGLFRSLINNMVLGLSVGFTRKLEINGVGYRAAISGNKLNLNLGFSHPVEFILPAGISAIVEGNTITISGIDKKLVGETAARIRKIRKPEPYKGKGVKYSDEVIRRKAGKAAAKGK
ncbi:MAG: 50S ribosomal protein L6 [Candidatus Falkowbacteria bacterium]|nr:50S ribosomal protein L6 [Candidatus Falkowbacteria bacterium]